MNRSEMYPLAQFKHWLETESRANPSTINNYLSLIRKGLAAIDGNGGAIGSILAYDASLAQGRERNNFRATWRLYLRWQGAEAPGFPTTPKAPKVVVKRLVWDTAKIERVVDYPLTDFKDWLLGAKKLTPGTARVYLFAIRRALRVTGGDFGQKAILTYDAALKKGAAQNLFRAGWRMLMEWQQVTHSFPGKERSRVAQLPLRGDPEAMAIAKMLAAWVEYQGGQPGFIRLDRYFGTLLSFAWLSPTCDFWRDPTTGRVYQTSNRLARAVLHWAYKGVYPYSKTGLPFARSPVLPYFDPKIPPSPDDRWQPMTEKQLMRHCLKTGRTEAQLRQGGYYFPKYEIMARMDADLKAVSPYVAITMVKTKEQLANVLESKMIDAETQEMIEKLQARTHSLVAPPQLQNFRSDASSFTLPDQSKLGAVSIAQTSSGAGAEAGAGTANGSGGSEGVVSSTHSSGMANVVGSGSGIEGAGSGANTSIGAATASALAPNLAPNEESV